MKQRGRLCSGLEADPTLPRDVSVVKRAGRLPADNRVFAFYRRRQEGGVLLA